MAHDDMSFGFALTFEEAEALLQELATDGSDFRADLEKNPLKALRKRGIAIAPHNVPPRIELPTPTEVQSILADLENLRGPIGADYDDAFPWPFPWHPFLAVAIMWRWHPFSFPSES